MRECLSAKSYYAGVAIKRYYEKGLLDGKWVRDYCHGTKSCVRYAMEERGAAHPDWMLPDGTLDEDLRGH